MEMELRNGGRTATTITGSNGTINLCPPSHQQTKTVDLTDHVHQLPCCIKSNAPSDVSHYFKPKSSGLEIDGGLVVQEAYFRGRNLQGVTIPLPQGYSGFILGKKNSSKGEAKKTNGRGKAPEISNSSENSWEMLAKCRNLTFWNHDSLPSHDDASLRLFHCFAVAKALHEPVNAEDLAS
ncbi:Ribonuclease H2 subunit C [Bienertia sinuspersici]